MANCDVEKLVIDGGTALELGDAGRCRYVSLQVLTWITEKAESSGLQTTFESLSNCLTLTALTH